MVEGAGARPLRAAVIGTGKISEEHLGFLQRSELAELVGVCDLSPAMAELARRRFGVTRAFTSHAEMLAEASPEVLHVLTPPHTHVAIVADGLEAGAHVIVEKPVAPTRAQFDELWEKARARGLRLVEDHNYRFNRTVLEVERLARAGRVGEVREVDVRMALGVRAGGRYADENLPHPSHGLPAGILHEFITHLAYLALRFLPSVERVSAHWSNHGGGELFRYDDLDALVIGDGVHARIRFTSAGWPESFSLTVRGTGGSIAAELFHPIVQVSRPRAVGNQLSPIADQILRGGGLIAGGIAGFVQKLRGVTPYEGLARFLEETYRALSGGGDPPVSYQDMERASALIEALLAQAAPR